MLHVHTAVAEGAGGTDYVGELFILGGIVLTVIGGWITSIIVKKLREPTRIETLWSRIDTLTEEVYGDGTPEKLGLKQRLANTEGKAAAAGRVIRDIARQWTGERPPRLNPDDLNVLDEDTVPAHWRMKP